MTKPEALTRQEGGDHYSKLPMQPVEFATRNRYDAPAFSILKYVTRWRDKDGLKDLRKARHFVDLRRALIQHIPNLEGPLSISTSEYCVKNALGDLESGVLGALELWVLGHTDWVIVGDLIDNLIKHATEELEGA